MVLVTVRLKVSEPVALLPSVAVTLTDITPTLAFNGVPLKVRVAALNASHDGRALPSERVAV